MRNLHDGRNRISHRFVKNDDNNQKQCLFKFKEICKSYKCNRVQKQLSAETSTDKFQFIHTDKNENNKRILTTFIYLYNRQ